MPQPDELYSEIIVLRSGDPQGPHLASGPAAGSGPQSSLGTKAVDYNQPSKGAQPTFPYVAGDVADRHHWPARLVQAQELGGSKLLLLEGRLQKWPLSLEARLQKQQLIKA